MWIGIFLIQALAIATILFFLKKKLDRSLIELALRQLAFLKSENQPTTPIAITIISHKKLNEKAAGQMTQLVKQHINPDGKINFQVDKRILGGLIIKGGGKDLDYSVKNRLQQAFGKNG